MTHTIIQYRNDVKGAFCFPALDSKLGYLLIFYLNYFVENFVERFILFDLNFPLNFVENCKSTSLVVANKIKER